MFAIYRKDVGGRTHDRYFVSYKVARREIEANVESMRKTCGAVVTECIDRMNTAKGFWEFEVRMVMPNGEKVSHAIIDGYFEDEPDKV